MVPGSNHNVATKHIVDYVFTKFSLRQELVKKSIYVLQGEKIGGERA
jgi:hypothetical protein